MTTTHPDGRRVRTATRDELRAALDAATEPGARIALLNALSWRTSSIDPSSAARLAREALKLSRHASDRTGIAWSAGTLADTLVKKGEHGSAARYFALAEKTIVSGGVHPEIIAEYYLLVAARHNKRNEFKLAIEFYTRALEKSRETDARHQTADALTLIGSAYMLMGDYTASLTYTSEGLKIAESVDYTRAITSAYSVIGIIEMHLGNFEGALKYFHLQLDLLESAGEDQGLKSGALGNIGETYLNMGEVDKALPYLNKALVVSREIGSKAREGVILLRMGNAYAYLKKDYDRALEYVQRSLDLARETGDKRRVAFSLHTLMRIYSEQGRLDQAIETGHEALLLAVEIDHHSLQCYIHDLLAGCCERSGDLSEAIRHYKLSYTLTLKLDKPAAARAVATLEAAQELERRESARQELLQRINGLEEELRTSVEELRIMAVKLIHQTSIVNSIKERVLPMSRRLERPWKEVARNVLQDLDQLDHENEDWRMFRHRFHELNQSLMDRLAQQYPQLTPSEIRVCGLLRLNLTTKEIAAILATSVRTIESHRYYIRKKLSLPADVNLSPFLASLGRIPQGNG